MDPLDFNRLFGVRAYTKLAVSLKTSNINVEI